MKRTRFLSAFVAPLALSLAGASVSASGGTARAQPSRTAQVAFPDHSTVKAEVAATEAEREHGLMMRTSLGELAGMLFVFDAPGLHAFWMKDTLISLDMLWLSADGKVVHIAESVPPCKTAECPTYTPHAAASYVLEVNGGFAKKHRVHVGDTVSLSGIDLKQTQPR